jgi:UPF0755 protein
MRRAEAVDVVDQVGDRPPARARRRGRGDLLACWRSATRSRRRRSTSTIPITTRLKRGMRLQSDPTIIYGISKGEPLYNKAGQRRTLYRSEIDRHTEWNTYQVDGLPKTPICNPGRDAIAAVLDPPETEYIFFVADGKGGHLFAKTNAEHERNVAAYRAYERGEIQKERAN